MKPTLLCGLAATLLLPLAAMGQPMDGRGRDGWQGRRGPMGPPEQARMPQAPQARNAPAHAGGDCPFCRLGQAAQQWRQHGQATRSPWMMDRQGHGRRGQMMMRGRHGGCDCGCPCCGNAPRGGRHGRMGQGMGPMMRGQGPMGGRFAPAPQGAPGEGLRQMWQQHMQHSGQGAMGKGPQAQAGQRPGPMGPERMQPGRQGPMDQGPRAHAMMPQGKKPEQGKPEKAFKPEQGKRPEAVREPGLAKIQTDLSALAKELREIRRDVTALRAEVGQMKQAIGRPSAPPADRPGPGRGMMGRGRPTPTDPASESESDDD